METNWLNIVNIESEGGIWDFNHYSTSSIIHLIKLDEKGEPETHIWMDYQEFEDLSKLIMKLNGK